MAKFDKIAVLNKIGSTGMVRILSQRCRSCKESSKGLL